MSTKTELEQETETLCWLLEEFTAKSQRRKEKKIALAGVITCKDQ